MAVETQVVRVQSGWLSKINWTQVVGFLSVLATLKGVEIPEEMKENLVLGITALWGFGTWVFRTFFNGTVTPATAATLTDTGAAKK